MIFRKKNFAKFCNIEKMDLVGRKSSLFQPTLGEWSSEISKKMALWSPFFHDLYDSPPVHNFFLYGIDYRKKCLLEIFCISIYQKMHFFTKKKKSTLYHRGWYRGRKIGVFGFWQGFAAKVRVPPGLFRIFHEILEIAVFDMLGPFFGLYVGRN